MEKRIELRIDGELAIIGANAVKNVYLSKLYTEKDRVMSFQIGCTLKYFGNGLDGVKRIQMYNEIKRAIGDVESFVFNENHPKEKMVIDVGEFKTLKEKPYVIVSLVVEDGIESPYKISDENVDVVLSNTTTHFNVKICYDEDNYLDDDEAIEEAKEKLRGYIGERAYFDAMDLSRFRANYDVSYVRVSYE